MFSKSTEYALRAVIYIAQKSTPDKKISIDEIALAIDSPKSFTAKILQLLSKGNKVISSTPGPHGGFFISPKAIQLPAKCILVAMGEENVLEKCVLGLKQCSEHQPCPMHHQYKQIRQQLNHLFLSKSIQQLANEIKDGVVFIKN